MGVSAPSVNNAAGEGDFAGLSALGLRTSRLLRLFSLAMKCFSGKPTLKTTNPAFRSDAGFWGARQAGSSSVLGLAGMVR